MELTNLNKNVVTIYSSRYIVIPSTQNKHVLLLRLMQLTFFNFSWWIFNWPYISIIVKLIGHLLRSCGVTALFIPRCISLDGCWRSDFISCTGKGISEEKFQKRQTNVYGNMLGWVREFGASRIHLSIHPCIQPYIFIHWQVVIN